MLRILDHGTKLIDLKHFPLVTDPVLLEQNGRTRFQEDSQSEQKHERGQYQEQHKRDPYIKKTFYKNTIKASVSAQFRLHLSSLEKQGGFES